MTQSTLKVILRSAQVKLWSHSRCLYFLNSVHLVPPPENPVDFTAYPEMCYLPPLRSSRWFRSHHLLPRLLMQPPNSAFTERNLPWPLASISLMFLSFLTRPLALWSLLTISLCLLLLFSSLTLSLPRWPMCSRLGPPLRSLHCLFLLPGATSSSYF